MKKKTSKMSAKMKHEKGESKSMKKMEARMRKGCKS